MKKFSYQMQGILNLKTKLEEQEKNQFALVKQRLNEEEEKLAALHSRKAAYEEGLKQAVTSRLIVSQIRQFEDAIESMKLMINIQKVQVKKAQQSVDLAMAKVTLAIQERKTHEKLKEQAFETYKKEIDEEEKKEIDELVSFQHSRQ